MDETKWYWMMMLMGLFHHENSMENSAEMNLSKVSDKHLLPNANASFRPDLQQFQQGMVHNFCLCCFVEFVLILTLNLLLSLRIVKTFSAQKWKPL